MHGRDTEKVGSGRSANDRFKDLWESRVAWSTMGAVALHAALFAWAGFQIVVPLVERAPSEGHLVVLPPSLSEGVGLEGMSTPVALPEEAAPESEPSVDRGLDGTEKGGAGEADETMDLWAAAAERLGYGRLFRAEVVEFDPGEAEGTQEGDSLTIQELDSEELLAELSHSDSLDVVLDLDRLTEVRPELAVMIPSMWILLRNPTEVLENLQRLKAQILDRFDRHWSSPSSPRRFINGVTSSSCRSAKRSLSAFRNSTMRS